MSITELSKLIRNKKVSPVTITQACLNRIRKIDSKLNAFITVTGEQALKQARIAEKEIIQGRWKGPIHGIPIALKDNIDTEGILTTAASGVYKNRIPTEDAELVIKLKKAGAIIIGKNNLHEFALGTTSHISHYGAVHNPWNLQYISGGSSGGSGAAVAAGLCYASIATDTGGSIRLPSACCGVTGFKPSYGLISINGIVPVIKSVDHAGPICRTIEDIAILMNALTTPLTGAGHTIDYLTSFNKLKMPQIGIMKDYKASDEINTVFKSAVNIFRTLGYTIREIALPVLPTSNFGEAEIEAYHHSLIEQSKNEYDPATLQGLVSMKRITSADYINQINQLETNRRNISALLFHDIDVMVLPTTSSLTPTIDVAKSKGPFALSDENTWPFNDYGLPVISIPCGFDKNGMPVGLQMVGPRWGESKVLDIAQRFQKHTSWHLKHPLI